MPYGLRSRVEAMPADARVLLLDMGAAERGRLAISLKQLGYAVLLADDLAAAQALGEPLPIVMVSVHNRPARIAELRAQLPNSAIIAIGARSLAAALEAWYAGAEGYLARPVHQNELNTTLEHVLRSRAARAATLAEAQPEQAAPAEFQRMAAELARQITTPLAPILGLADLLSDELPPEHPGRKYAQAIGEAALHIRDIAWMLEDMARKKQ
jgi:DNA-binding response OmpR family regulator